MIVADTPAPLTRTAVIRQLARTDRAAAITELTAFLQELFRIDVAGLKINDDRYSLNSLNGFFHSGKQAFFFKFHQEEGEDMMSGEYYRADLIAKAGLPVDLPIHMSAQSGEQILVYRMRNEPQFSDVLYKLDKVADAGMETTAIAAEIDLNTKILEVAKRTLTPVTPQQVHKEPIHRLFHDRLIDPKTKTAPGGRYKRFYINQTFCFPGATLEWDEFSNANLVLNGQRMQRTFGQIFDDALVHLNPDNLTGAGGIVAHGDAHNANVWFEQRGNTARLCYFDPAFAGEHVPSLLAEIKATFHNVFAHPLWLYDQQEAAKSFVAQARYENGTLELETDWHLTPIRQKLLAAKTNAFWKPFLRHLMNLDMLPANWEDTVRSALAMSPALVMNLRSGADRHNRVSSTIGFYVLALAGSRPENGTNMFTDFFQKINPETDGG